MSVYVSLLPPSNHPILNHHSHYGHFSFTCTIQLGFRSLKNDRITDYPGPSSAEFPLHELDRRPDPSSPSWTELAKLISSAKKLMCLEDHITIQWYPKPLDKNPDWIQVDNEENLIGHVLSAARKTVARQPEGKKPSSLCLKINKVVEVSVNEFMVKWITARMKPFRSDNSVYEDFKGIFSEDVKAALSKCRRLCQVMDRDFGVALPAEACLYWVLLELREWERKER